MKTKFKTILKFTFFICSLSQVEAQNIGINGTGAVAHTSALLDVDNAGGAPRGILIPRVALNATTDGTTIATPAVSLMVYNTNATMANGVGVGFYTWNGTIWNPMVQASNSPGTAGDVLKSQGAGSPPQWLSGSGGGGGGSALGSTMMTNYMDAQGLFTPHTNTCVVATEAFVPLFTGATVGFCMDKNQQVAPMFWTNAIDYCLSQGKRLPEPNEWQRACDNAGSLGLLNMINDWEWASNMALPMYNGAYSNVGSSKFGAGSCASGFWGDVGATTANRDSYAVRCAH